MSFDLDLLDDILPQPTDAPGRALGKFLPKARRKNDKVVQHHISPGDPVQDGERISPLHASKDLNSNDCLQRDQTEIVLPGSDCLDDIFPESAMSNVVGKFQPKVCSKASKLVPPSSSPSTCEPLSCGSDPAQCAPKPFEGQESTRNSHLEDLVSDGDNDLQTDSGRSKEKEDKVLTNLEQMKHSLLQASETEALVTGASASGIDGDLQTDQRPSGGEAADIVSSLDWHDDFLVQSHTAERGVGKFRPKLKSGSLTKKINAHMSTNSYNALRTNSVPEDTISELLINKDSATHTECSQAELQEVGAPFDIESLDGIPSQPYMTTDPETRVRDHSVDLQAEHEHLQGEAESELSEHILLQPSASAARGMGKFQPKLGTKIKKAKVCHDGERVGSSDALTPEIQSVKSSVLTFLRDSSTSLEHSSNDVLAENAKASAPEAASFDDLSKLDYSVGTEERDRISVGKRTSLSQEAFGEGIKDHSQGILDGGGSATNDSGVIDNSQTFRQLRKRKFVCNLANELGDEDEESWELSAEKSNDSQMVEESSDDEYMGERSSVKRAPRKPRRFQDAKEKPTEQCKKASFGSDSSAQESQKKKFFHSTRRSKRRVGKVLLETPEEDIDPMKLRIKDLIMLAEARERITIKEAATKRQSVRDQSDSSFCNNSSFGNDNQEQGLNDDGDEANHKVHFTSTKLNYHTYMSRTRAERWSKVDTELFYQAVHQFGTDFAMIQQLFPNRTRHQIKLKFKNEERKHPLQIADALIHRSKDHSHFELVIQRLKAQEEENLNGDASNDTWTESQTGTTENEEGQVEVDKKEEQEVNDRDQGHDTLNPNEHQDVFDWSQFDIRYPSSPHSMEKNEYDIS